MKDSLTHDQLEQLLPAAALEILEGDGSSISPSM